MSLNFNDEYQVRINIPELITDVLDCERHLERNLNLIGFTKCHIFGKIMTIFFKPPRNFTDEYVLKQIDMTLKEMSIIFVKAVIRHYVSNATRTVIAGAAGGIVGGIAGAALAALAEKALFGWKDMCECKHGNFNELIITSLD
ncbi:hypothetical protein [Nitrosopumilus sp.]|uniref:hypothetical protein n=1 Tax=Nitrosopumilus sp. TaxID=2024843 RepID=UPI003D120DBF